MAVMLFTYLTHYSTKARKRSQLDAKLHWNAVTPDYLTKSFAQVRDSPQEYIQALLGHADEKMTKHYQEGHGDKTIDYVEVSAELAF
ncbi:hypothetical protein HU755_21000 [Pseudomonas sp. SWRI111]|uniref:hypothetical protein n=1 Tax=Pseudomonas sp. SWRI111 TaxID=2745507 RepID=UPI001645E16A|nr:hypothetical protein [Pseudomonas sp. SWRI111]MBC3209287.1 hypothetical protein [Pseudomonas sp. SWRI111]